jgi:hypothetical protein
VYMPSSVGLLNASESKRRRVLEVLNSDERYSNTVYTQKKTYSVSLMLPREMLRAAVF